MEPRVPSRRRLSVGRPGAEPVPGYRLLRRVGSGGSGEVWRAEAPGGLPVALKLIRLSGKLGGRERSNLRILRAIRHPNLLAYFGAWTFDELLVIGMELADHSLWDRFKVQAESGLAGIPLEELLNVLGEVAKVVDFLNEPRHELDGKAGVAVFHRDIKPQNIMLLGGGVKVADFGLSSLDVQGATSANDGLTYAYAAPETFRKEVVSQSDQYSLAVTYCLLRGGRLPFTGPPTVIMLGHLFQPPDLTMLPDVERPVAARALAKEPGERWPDCRGFVEALRQCRAAGSPELIPIQDEEPGEASEPRRLPRLPVTVSSEMPTGLLDDCPDADASSDSHLGTSVMLTVPSEVHEASPAPVVPVSLTSPVGQRDRLSTCVSNGAGIALLAGVTTILGIVAIGEPAVDRTSSRQIGRGLEPAAPIAGRSLQQPGGPASQLARFEDEFIYRPRWNRRVVPASRTRANPGLAAGTLVAGAEGRPALEGPVEFAVTDSVAPSLATVPPAYTWTRLGTDASRWVGRAKSSLEQWLSDCRLGLRTAVAAFVARPDSSHSRRSPKLAVAAAAASPAAVQTVASGRENGPVADKSEGSPPGVSLSPVTMAHPLAGKPVVTTGGFSNLSWPTTSDPIMVNHGVITYTAFSQYEGIVADQAMPHRFNSAGAMIRFGRGRGVFGRRGEMTRR